ncbi:MAG: hypothetical protein JW929_13875 [Anaerolineales bacterium]|nr:hypothetical protein [Anaerolineales bacterium]
MYAVLLGNGFLAPASTLRKDITGNSTADWSYIPGGTFWNAVNLVRPDLPEDKHWPFLWQEREYIPDAACMFMVLAADRILEAPKPAAG